MSTTTYTSRLLFAGGWLIALFLLLPGLVTIPVALNNSRFVALPHGMPSLRHFATLFNDSGWADSMLQSAGIALTTTLLAVSIGTVCAIGMWRLPSRHVAWLSAMVIAPLILPPIVSGLALYRAWVFLDLYDSWLGVVIAHTILALPFVVISVLTSLSMLDPRLEQASRSLGATPWHTTLHVIVPNIKTGIFSATIFAFIISWDEIVVTLFVASRSVYTLPRRMWDGIRENVDPTVAAVGTLLIILTLLIVFVGGLARRGRGSTERLVT